MKWLGQHKIKEIGRKERNFHNIPDTEQMREMGLTPPPHIIPRLSARLRGLSLCHKLDLPRPIPPPQTRPPLPSPSIPFLDSQSKSDSDSDNNLPPF